MTTTEPAATAQRNAVTRRTSASPDAVFAVLADGWSYAAWVVGASRIRDVTGGWPAEGARIHHSVGAWPLMLDDATWVTRVVPGRSLDLTARALPVGHAEISFEVRPDGAGSVVVMSEDATTGPGRWLMPGPLRRAALRARNEETLRRLCYRAEAGPRH